MIFDLPDIQDNSKQCLSAPFFDGATETSYWWVGGFLFLICFAYSLDLGGIIMQYNNVKDEERCKESYENMTPLVKELYKWEEAVKSIGFTRKFYKFLIWRELTCTIPFYLAFWGFYGPAYMWNFYLGKFLKWGLCENGDGTYNMQLLCGVFCALTFKTILTALHTPWTAYQMWGIEKEFGLAEPTVGSFICTRLTAVIQFMILWVPIGLFLAKVIEWTGDYLLLAIFGGTALVKLLMMYIYPKVIMPMTGSYEPLPDYTHELVNKYMTPEADLIGFKPSTMKLEKTYLYDVHVNASVVLGNIILGEPLFKTHASHPDEIMAIFVHELGHYKYSHLSKSLVVDTAYMVVFGGFMMLFINQPKFLMSFGFP